MAGRVEFLSQVFLKDRDLVHSLVERSSISGLDTVIEIGPGSGIITDELVKKSGRVITVEKDTRLHEELVRKYQGNSTIEFHNEDFLGFNLPNFPYKVFSNIPFAIEAHTVRKLIDDSHNPPTDSYLVVRREIAERLAGISREGQFSILHKPWFKFEIFHYFKRGDFQPKPLVESAMLRFQKRDISLIDFMNKRLYELFINIGFSGGGRLKQNLSDVFTNNQLNRLAQNFGFKVNDMPSELTIDQWVGMFEFVQNGISQIQRQKLISKSRK